MKDVNRNKEILKEKFDVKPIDVHLEKGYPLSILNKFSHAASKSKIGRQLSKGSSFIEVKPGASSSKYAELLKNSRNEKGFSLGKQDNKEAIEIKFITKFMRKGKKELAEITLLKALKKVEQELLKKEILSSSITKPVGDKQVKSVSLGKAINPGDSINAGSYLGQILEKIIDHAKPLIRLKKVRIAGATHQKPVALTKKQAETDAIKRIILNAKGRSEKSSTLKLAKEFEEIYLNTLSNKTLTEVRELHKLAEANKANITLK